MEGHRFFGAWLSEAYQQKYYCCISRIQTYKNVEAFFHTYLECDKMEKMKKMSCIYIYTRDQTFNL